MKSQNGIKAFAVRGLASAGRLQTFYRMLPYAFERILRILISLIECKVELYLYFDVNQMLYKGVLCHYTLLYFLSQNSEPQYKCAKKVILAVGPLALRSIDWDGFKDEEVQDYMQNSIQEAQGSKQYLAYDSDWWRVVDKTSWLTVSDTPLRQTFHYAHSGSSNSYVLNSAYTDSNACKMAITTFHPISKDGFSYLITRRPLGPGSLIWE